MAQITLTILGLQRVGTSLGLAVKRLMTTNTQHRFTIIGSDPDPALMQAARKLGAVDQTERGFAPAVAKADLIFMALPYGVVKDTISIIGEAMRPGAVVMDASPVKLPSIQWAKKYFRRDKDGQPEAFLVGVTPTINPAYLTDPRNSTDSATADLFDNSLFILSPAADCPDEAIQLVVDFATLLGSRVHFTDPAEQDGMMAAMDGLPLLLQLALFRSLHESASWKDLQKLGNPLFALSIIRLDQDKPNDLAQTVYQNRENTLRTLSAFIETLNELREALSQNDSEYLTTLYTSAIEQAAFWRVARDKNDWDDIPKMPPVTPPSLFGGLGKLIPGRKAQKDDDDS